MRKILVGFDGSQPAAHAVETAALLARALGSTITVLTAASDRLRREDGVETVALDEDLARRIAARGAALARERGAPEVEALVSIEAPDDALAMATQQGYDLVVVGHRGVGALREMLLGSTAKSVMERVSTAVLIVR
jgi:nucleotide-binding universal stress UspA family protein